MLRTLKDLFDALLPPASTTPPADAEHLLQLSTAVLLVEVMRSDASIDAAERTQILAALRGKFALGEDELARLLELAEQTAREATDLFRFTSVINERFEMPQKLRMIELMWRVAYADGQLDAHENHLMRRVAELLYVPHGAYVAAKARARDADG